MFPTREEAERLLKDAESCNGGDWVGHSRIAAHCAERIAAACGDMDAERAYVFGLLHDIGRKFGVRHLGHVSDGYRYMMSLGWDEVARICLTHSFQVQRLDAYIGKNDTTGEKLAQITQALSAVHYDDYDRLIQLCDALAGSKAVMNIEARMLDVKARYGSYPRDKWDANLSLLAYFEEKTGRNLYDVVQMETEITVQSDRQRTLPF